MKKKQLNEIVWNVINSMLAGAISFFSSMIAFLSDKGFDSHDVLTASMIAFTTSGLIAIYKFQDYWKHEEKEYSSNYMFDIL